SSGSSLMLVNECFLSEFVFLFSFTQVSQAAAELQQYCMQNACKDALLVGVPAGSNPFREPRSCALL
uniref:Guanine nucleotide-binding protein subunit gamma n=1 Tax=Athene cunicularia TaxID=194338 RepID=A0A663N9C8_ATHCN